MGFTGEDIRHVAALARLDLKESEIDQFVDQLSSILGFVDKLSEVDTEGVEPMSHSIEMHNRLRKDEVRGCTQETRDALVDGFPESENETLKVKAVFS